MRTNEQNAPVYYQVRFGEDDDNNDAVAIIATAEGIEHADRIAAEAYFEFMGSPYYASSMFGPVEPQEPRFWNLKNGTSFSLKDFTLNPED